VKVGLVCTGGDGGLTSFAAWRARHFRAAIEEAGHAVIPLRVGPGAADPRDPAALSALRRAAAPAGLIVSAGPFWPGLAAAALVGDRPWWGDLPGDPFAEAQAVALRSPADPARAAAALEAGLAVLLRADRISPISEAQGSAAWGQLGLLGRLPVPHEELVQTIPVGALPDVPRPPPAPPPPLRVGLLGALTAWLDVEGLAAALERAWARGLPVELHRTGGPVPGQAQDGGALDRLSARFPGRIIDHGVIPEAELAARLAPLHAGLVLDAPGLEPRLGSRTRALLCAAHGIELICTPTTELCRALVAAGGAWPVSSGEPGGLVDTFEALLRSPAARAPAARAWVHQNADPRGLAAPLRAFLERPRRAAPGALPIDALRADRDRLQAALDAVHQSPTWRALSPAHPALGRIRGDLPRRSARWEALMRG